MYEIITLLLNITTCIFSGLILLNLKKQENKNDDVENKDDEVSTQSVRTGGKRNPK